MRDCLVVVAGGVFFLAGLVWGQRAAFGRPAIFDSLSYVEGGYTADRLTNNGPNWKSEYVNFFVPMKDCGLVSARVENVQRFGVSDKAISLSYVYPFDSGVANLDGEYSANAAFLAKNSIGLGWNGKLPEGFGYTLGVAQRNYSEGLLNLYTFGVEKNAGEFRLAYTASISTIDKSKGEFSGRVQLLWISPGDNRLGFTYSGGVQPSVVSLGNLTTIQTQYVQLDGLYRLTKKVGVSAAFWHSKEGDYYQRNGGQVGLRVAL